MNHEKLVCYRTLVEVAEALANIMANWPKGYFYVEDQLKRAMASAILNLAEGNGKQASSKERKRFFQISLGSIAEVAACLDLAKIFSLISGKETNELKEQLRASYCRIRKLP